LFTTTVSFVSSIERKSAQSQSSEVVNLEVRGLSVEPILILVDFITDSTAFRIVSEMFGEKDNRNGKDYKNANKW
jgi:hypothetical protein